MKNLLLLIKLFFIIFKYSQTEQTYTISYEEELLKGGKTKIIPYKENNINYYMIYNYDSKKYFYKYSSSGERINVFEDSNNNNANYTDITYLENKKLFFISGGNHFIFNGTNCEIIYNNENTIFLSSVSNFKDSSIIVMNNKNELQNFFPEIFFYNNEINLMTQKNYNEFLSSNGRGLLISTEILYHFLLFYTDSISNNMIIRTLSFDSNEFKELNLLNSTDYKLIFYYYLMHIDKDDFNLIIFCFKNEQFICNYGKYDENEKRLIYDKNNEFIEENLFSDYQTGILVDKKKFYIISSKYLSTEGTLYLTIVNFENNKPLYVKSYQNSIKITTNYFTLQNLEFVLFDNKSPAAIYMSSLYNDISEDSFKTKIGYINNLEFIINESSLIKDINTNYYNDYFEITIIFNDIITNIEINSIQLINKNNSSKIINSSSFQKVSDNSIIVRFSYPNLTEEYFLKFIYNNNNVYYEDKNNLLLKTTLECNGENILLNNKCVSGIDLINKNLTEFCNEYCTKSNYKFCIKGFGKIEEKAKCFCKNRYDGKKCENVISTEIEDDNNENFYVKEIIKKKTKGIIENNKFISQFESYEIYQIIYINSKPIFQYYDNFENEKENQVYGFFNVTFPETYIKIYNF